MAGWNALYALSMQRQWMLADTSLTQEQKQAEKEWAVWHRDNAEGMFHSSRIAFGDGYGVIMRETWKVRDD
jgi:hypothetical protein